MIALVATAWAAWVAWVAWSRRPLRSSPALLPDHAPTRGGPTAVERWGSVAQRRLPVLDELPTAVVGVASATVLVGAFVTPSTSLLIGVGVLTAARMRSISRQRADARRALAQAPAVVDLLALCLDAGLTPRLAISRIATLVEPPLGPALAVAAGRCDRGESLAVAVGPMCERGHPLRPTLLAVVGAERSGAPLTGALDRVAGDARAAVRRSAEERARRLPVLMLFPLVCCVLPAFGLLAVAPLVLGGLGDLL